MIQTSFQIAGFSLLFFPSSVLNSQLPSRPVAWIAGFWDPPGKWSLIFADNTLLLRSIEIFITEGA